jgi:hypothetical protein
MIFSVQRYIEDYFQRRNLIDNDQYAVHVANSFAASMHQADDSQVLRSVHHIRTVFFKNNAHLERSAFELQLVQSLRSRFKKNVVMHSPVASSVNVRLCFAREE